MNLIKTIRSIALMTALVIGSFLPFTKSLAQNPSKQAFVLFYMSSCPHCRRFDPVLEEYARDHHIPVLAYTLDGKTLPSFPESVVPNREELVRFFPSKHPSVPALFLMDSERQVILPVAAGEASYEQLDSRVRALMPGYSEEDDYV